MPGRPPPPSRDAGGRGGRSPPPEGGVLGRRPMPWVEENGLLPGRGAPGRGAGRGVGAPPSRAAGACGWAGGCVEGWAFAGGSVGVGGAGGASSTGAGFGPGLGPGFAAGRGAAGLAAGASAVSSPAGAACSAPFSGPFSASFSMGASAAGAFGSAASSALSGAGAACLAAAFFADAFLAAFFSASARRASPYSFLKRISTGGSTVDDADLTNSPISLSLARTTLLSTPSSLASSCTRTLATLLLLVRAVRRRGPLAGVHAHREVLIECS